MARPALGADPAAGPDPDVDVDAARHGNERSRSILSRRRVPDGFGRSAPKITSTVLGVLAAISLLSSLSIGFRHLIRVPRGYVDDYIISMPDTSFAWAFVLALVAGALGARKRISWWVTVAYIVIFGATNALWFIPAVASGYDVSTTERINIGIGLALQLVALAYLLASYRQFYTRVRPGAIWRSLVVLALGLAAATLLGWGLVELAPHDLESDERLAYAFNRVVAFASIDRRTFNGHHAYGVINGLLGLLGALALIAAAAVLFRSQRLTNLMSPTDARVIRELIAAYDDDDSLAYFSTRRDKAVVFAPNGKAAITYRVELGVGLAGGDPVGDRRHWSAAIAEFVSVCDRYGWRPGVMGASERGAAIYADAGFTTLEMGDEAIVHTRDYRLSGPGMRPVRQAVTRCHRAGVTVRIRRHRELSADEMRSVIADADAWRDTAEERGFSMALGRLGDPEDGDCILVEALMHADTPDETRIGLLSFVPWGRTGASLDLMRRDHTAINGVVETMVSDFALDSARFGISEISLNFAAFRTILAEGDRIGAGPVMRLAHGALMFGSRFVQMDSLYRSNAKYQPEWVPRYLCCEDTRKIVWVGLSAVVAEGFVQLPVFGRRTRTYGSIDSFPSNLDADTVIAEVRADRDTGIPAPHRTEQVRVRLDKLAKIRDDGIDPYPPASAPSHRINAARQSPPGTAVSVAGRVMRLRDFGSVVFADLEDLSGEIQVLVDAPALTTTATHLTDDVDLGDLIRVDGVIGHSRTGELSVLADSWTMQAKCLHPLPDKWKGLSDPETRVRARHLDLVVNPAARETLATRAAVIRAMRDHLYSLDFLEVETPILQTVHGGANAEPFRTHINAYDLDLYLRIAPELYLKRLCVGGVERVFELGRNFRNEGVDFSHNPEFTSLEAYQAHGDYMTMLDITRDMITAAAIAAHGSPVILRPADSGEGDSGEGDSGGFDSIDISGPWPVRSVYDAVSDAAGTTITVVTGDDELRAVCERLDITLNPEWDHGQIVLEMYEHLVEARTTMPTFYIDFPTSVSPLTRDHRSKPGVAERWDLVAWGVELGTAYTELTDPLEQRRRLTEQSALAAGGDPEAMELDEDFLDALEYGMMPTGGLGIGVDRVVMLVTGRSIRETLTFPMARPR